MYMYSGKRVQTCRCMLCVKHVSIAYIYTHTVHTHICVYTFTIHTYIKHLLSSSYVWVPF